jgi:hypothetical protein
MLKFPVIMVGELIGNFLIIVYKIEMKQIVLIYGGL